MHTRRGRPRKTRELSERIVFAYEASPGQAVRLAVRGTVDADMLDVFAHYLAVRRTQLKEEHHALATAGTPF